ncbi:cytochrome P450 [Phlegmacium glaucopus]|nr:cytochrome P450 [Phlegmacium glaucopus]
MLSHLPGSYVTTTQLVVSLAGILLSYGIYKISTFIHDEMTSPSHDIPGPPSPSFLYGNSQHQIQNNSVLQEGWLNQYGTTIQYKAMLGTSRLLTTDLKAINYILFNSYDYPKPEDLTYNSRELFGNGVFVNAEGDVHKHQRKILNPAFGPQQIRDLTEIFVEKALELRDIWRTEIAKHDGIGPIECLSWMSRTTLDIIGLAGKSVPSYTQSHWCY